MNEFEHDLNQCCQAPHSNRKVAFEALRSVFERHTKALEIRGACYSSDQSTPLLDLANNYSNQNRDGVTLLLLLIQQESVPESAVPTFIRRSQHLLSNIDHEFTSFASQESFNRFREALECFDQVMCTPAQIVSAVAVESIKKATLVSLLEHGTAYKIPGGESSMFIKNNLIPPPIYTNIAKAFEANDKERLADVVKEGAAVLRKDSNFGLAKQVVSALTSRRLINISRTYATITLEGIARALEIPEDSVEAEVLRLNRQGQIRARINPQTSMVEFLEPDTAVSTDVICQLQSALCQSAAATENLRDLHANVLTHPLIVSRAVSNSQHAGSVAAAGPGVMMRDDGYAEEYL